MDEDFSNPSKSSSAYNVESSFGSHFEYTENSLKVSGCRNVSQGPVFDLMDVINCVKPGV